MTGVSSYHTAYITSPYRDVGPSDIGYAWGFLNVET
jgi:hypothetical protein